MLSLRARLALYTGLALAGLVLVLLVTRRPADPLDNPAYDALVRAHQHRMAADSLALDSARTALTVNRNRVDSSLIVYRRVRDSAFVPVSHTDTVEVLAKLPAFLASTDSLHAACTALAQDCDRFRVRAESSIAGLTADRDLWRTMSESRLPSRWAGVREWGIRGLLVFGAFKLGQGVR